MKNVRIGQLMNDKITAFLLLLISLFLMTTNQFLFVITHFDKVK